MDSNNSRSSQVVNGNSIQDENDSLGKKSDIGNLRRKKSQKNSKQKAFVLSESKVPEIADSLALHLFHSLKAAAYSLCHAFKQPIILR